MTDTVTGLIWLQQADWNDTGTDCYGNGAGSSFAGVASGHYWSSASAVFNPDISWLADLHIGEAYYGSPSFKATSLRIWPVRGGLR